MAIIFSVRQQIRQQIQCLCLDEPALSVGWPSHSEGVDSYPALEVASRFQLPIQSDRQMAILVAVQALLEAQLALLVDSVCTAEKTALCTTPDGSEDPCFQKGPAAD